MNTPLQNAWAALSQYCNSQDIDMQAEKRQSKTHQYVVLNGVTIKSQMDGILELIASYRVAVAYYWDAEYSLYLHIFLNSVEFNTFIQTEKDDNGGLELWDGVNHILYYDVPPDIRDTIQNI